MKRQVAVLLWAIGLGLIEMARTIVATHRENASPTGGTEP